MKGKKAFEGSAKQKSGDGKCVEVHLFEKCKVRSFAHICRAP